MGKYSGGADIISCETGETLGHMVEGSRVIPPKSQEFLDSHTKWMPDETFVKTFSPGMTAFAKKASGSEMNMLMLLSPYIRYQSGVLAYPNGRPLTRESIAAEMGVSIKTVERTLTGLQSKGAIAYSKTDGKLKMFVNPYLLSVGKWINNTLAEMFKDTEWAKVYRQQSRQEKKGH